jgi:phosphoribosylanthranilate isomerase
MFIKICANTNLADARLAAELGVDAVGFVFAKSKRQVTAEAVAEIVAELPVAVEKVGVFDVTDPIEIEDHLVSAGLTVAQLHGAFDASLVRALAAKFGGELNIIQTVVYAVDAEDRATADAQFERTLRNVFDEAAVWAVLVDAGKSGASGGLGVAFDWAHVAEIVERAIGVQQPRPRLILAGGLNAFNVVEAIEALKPWGVDVASGVEASPGKKDPVRLRDFIQAARSTKKQLRRGRWAGR